MKIMRDDRPRCDNLGPVVDDNGRVPCELHEGHAGRHVWDGYHQSRTWPNRKGDASPKALEDAPWE